MWHQRLRRYVCQASGGTLRLSVMIRPAVALSAEHLGNTIWINLLDTRRLPARLAVLVHNHRPYAFREIGVPHCCPRQRQFGGLAMREGHGGAMPQRLEGPAKRRWRYCAQRGQRLGCPTIAQRLQLTDDLA